MIDIRAGVAAKYAGRSDRGQGMGKISSGRRRWLVAFTVMLCAACAAPVLADSQEIGVGPARVAEAPIPATDAPAPSEETQPSEEIPPMDPQAMAEKVAAAEGEELARDKWLESPEAIHEREESRTAFDEISSADAEGLLTTAFADFLEQLDGDPARALSELQIEELVGEYGALVPDAEGGSQLVESSIPIRSQVPGEEGKPVDLSLKEVEGGFESQTPATDIRLPTSLGGAIEIGEELAISALPGNGEVSAVLLGDKDLFFGNSDTDTDTVVAPLTRSVEILQQLRSPKSPEEFRFGLSLPKETTLRSDGLGGAEIVDPEGKRVAFVPMPYATDAQGTNVPVSMKVDGEAIIVSVSHRSLDVAYPLLLDPELVAEDWYWSGGGTFGLGYWAWQELADYENSYNCIVTCWGYGLYARSKGSKFPYDPGTWGQWVYTAPNSTAFISRTLFSTLRGSVYNCPTYQPHGYVGIYNVYASAYHQPTGIYSPPSFSAPSFDTGWVGTPGARQAVVGIGTGAASSELACGHDFYVGGATIWQDDPENPGVSVSGMPGGWISDATPAFTITANGSDPGLGVRKITFTRDGSPNGDERPVGCNGTAASRCPVNRTEYFYKSALSFDEGKNNAYMTVEDVTGKKTTPPYTWQTYVDMTKPDVTLTGQLAEVTEEDKGGEQGDKKVEELSLPVYNLEIKATDIGTESNADKKKRSGVRKVEVKLDGVKKEAWEQPCADSCEMKKTYPLKLNNLDADKHVLEVIATDGVKKERVRTIEFEYIPATGMKEEYVMQYFPLPDGEGNEAEEEQPDRPELAVNVINGNLVYREKDVDIEGYGVDLEVERYYNSLLPEEENTEWGDGWTLAQTPDLEPEGGPGAPTEAMVIGPSGAVDGSVALPTSVNEEEFDAELQAVITKDPDGGYEMADATGETGTAIAFDENGTVEELRTEGEASVDYDYEAGDLSEIEVDDPASTDIDPEDAAELAEIERTPSSFKYAFGLQGSADGQFNVATDVAIDPTDTTVWVADDENDRIQHFDAEGKYLSKFASCADPGALDVDLQGDIYVACSSVDKVQKFNDKGELLKQIVSVSGSGNSQVRFPLDLALDSEQNLYVADTENDRIQKFNAAGAFVKSIPAGGRPWGLDIAPDGNIWSAEAPQRRVSVFDPQGNVLLRFGSPGSGHSQFERPVDVEVDAAGFAYVTDAVNNRVQVFDSEGSYLTQFGEKGTGSGQLNTDWWLRIAVGPSGDVWVTDQGNSRLHKWINPAYLSSFKYAFGLQGSADGQFKVATDVAIDPTDTTVWVADDENDRIQHFDAEGKYLSKFASCADPGAVDVDLQGDIYVACSSVDKVQKFNDKGTSLKTIAVSGTGNGQVRFPLDLALDSEQNLYVADTENARVQKFNAAGAFVKPMPVGESGRPWGVDVAPDGNIWTAEPSQYRVSVFDPQGNLLFRFGSQGTGRSQFKWAADVEVDESGFAYVTDAVNNRVQVFDSKGAYVTKFGEKGTGSGQLNTDWWLRVAVGPSGDVWVTDQGNSRLHKWKAAGHLRPGYGSKIQDDPEVEIETPGGLVASVEGEDAGEHIYEHDGDLLTSHEDEGGETSYEYDGDKLTRVELPNGTWAEIEYGATDGRVKKVTVDPAGAPVAKTTSFTYEDQPRSTTVILPDDPAVTYDIGKDGSVFKWRNALKPPEFEVVAGTLYDVANKETASPINAGDYNLTVKAYSEEGIASIQIYANGNQLISQSNCPQIDMEPEKCKKLPDEWVTNTGNHAPGILNIEMVIEDGLEHVASKRFWVNIPYTPPPSPDQPVTPKFAEVLQFREKRGLDLDLDPIQDEFELNDRVFDTINDWIQGNPVAVASMERWGAPLRTPEAAELEYREQYINYNTPLIEDWGEAHASTFAGYVIDEAAGGIIRVGFTSDPAGQLSELEQQVPLMAQDRFGSRIAPNGYSLASLQQLVGSLSSEQENNSNLSALIVSVAIDIRRNLVRVGGPNTSQLAASLQSLYGASSPFAIEYAPGGISLSADRLMAGENLRTRYVDQQYQSTEVTQCTAGYGAFRKVKKKDGSWGRIPFVLTAGHCSDVGQPVQKFRSPHGQDNYYGIGQVAKSSWQGWHKWETDALAVKLEGLPAPDRIFWQGSPPASRRVTPMGRSHPGDELCFSGVISNFPQCGEAHEIEERRAIYEYGVQHGRQWKIPISVGCEGGDSGAPVWNKSTGRVVGLLVEKESARNFPDFWDTTTVCYATPLINPKGVPMGQAPGVFGAPAFEGLYLKEAS
ncbi:MAG TPA: DUF6531 domain-containing protein [Solirubrobacterales bacterium]|nr:DUF6531 domain-containing protein [Solirubrobacterales bacterium]